jgi:signal transduction histidine kinase
MMATNKPRVRFAGLMARVLLHWLHKSMEINNAVADLEPGIGILPVFAEAEPDAVHASRILIIDDEVPNVRLLERILSRAGFDNFISITDSREAAALFADFQPDLVLTDWLMPETDGWAVIEQLRALTATDDYLPIVVLTADITPQARKQALTAGATDFLIKPFDQIEVILRIENLLKARLSHLIIQAQNATLETSVRLRTIELESALDELRSSQKQVIQQERLAALGTMAGGIAHDFNNALGIIIGFGELLLRDAEHCLTRENATRSITTILTAAEDAAKIVHRLREFYRPDRADEQRLPVDLNLLIEQAVSLTEPRWQTDALADERTIKITTDFVEMPVILGDAAELREVLTNLIFNAVDALPQGGTIAFATRHESKAAILEVRDSGTGMSEEVRLRCFEPFFTTKGKRGTGLGLSMVFGIIRRHGGTIKIVSQPGKGAVFTINLPLSTSDSIKEAEPDIFLPGSLRVLAVDDQPLHMQLLCEHLRDDLHTVETACSGSQALEKFRTSHFDLVITDHVMAEMTGQQLAGSLKRIDPEIPVILLTAYPGEAIAGNQKSQHVDLVLAKPLSRAALRRGFAEVQNARAGR